MTQSLLETARSHVSEMTATLGYEASNLKFLEGMIEFLGAAGVKPNSMDLIISNCVVNLSPNKEAVIRSCYATLRDGGEFHFSDVYSDRRLPQATRYIWPQLLHHLII